MKQLSEPILCSQVISQVRARLKVVLCIVKRPMHNYMVSNSFFLKSDIKHYFQCDTIPNSIDRSFRWFWLDILSTIWLILRSPPQFSFTESLCFYPASTCLERSSIFGLLIIRPWPRKSLHELRWAGRRVKVNFVSHIR